MDFDWKSIVGTVAPTIATALGGPFAGVATKFLTGKLLDNEDATEEELAQAIQGASPDTLAKLKELDNDFKVRMKELGIEEKKLDLDWHKANLDDRDSARQREVETDDHTNAVLAGVVIIGFFGTVAFVLSGKMGAMDGAAIGLAGTIVGYVSAKADQVLGYYFGGMTKGKTTQGMVSKVTGLLKKK